MSATVTVRMLVLGLAAATLVTSGSAVGAQGGPLGVVINEVVADNDASLLDVDGDSPDWIELANPTDAPVDLGASYLSDASDDLTRWQFPAGVTIAPGEHLVVFASGKDRAVVGQELHTDFGLSGKGEEVVLTAPDGSTVIDTLAFPALGADVSFGRFGPDVGPMEIPTPGQANRPLAAQFVAAPTADVGNSLVDTAVIERLVSATAGAVIHYTLDGSIPSGASPVAANGQVMIEPTDPVTTLRAIALAPGMDPSPVATFSYVEPTLAAASVGGGDEVRDGIRSLPMMSVTTAAGVEPAGEAAYEPARIDYVDQHGPGFSEEVGIKHFGNASLAHPKKSFRVNFSRTYGSPELDYPLFSDRGTDFFAPATSFDQLEIRSYSHDGFGGVYWAGEGSYLANEFGRLLSLELGTLNTHGRPVTLFVDGTFRGLYQLRERINDGWMSEYFGGAGDDYESWVIDDRSGLNRLSSGDGSVLAALGAATNFADVDHLVDADSLITNALVLWNHAFYWEMEWRVVGPSDPDHPSGLHVFANDLDLGFGGLYDPGRSPGMRDYLARFDDEPEFRSRLQRRAAQAFCGTGPMTDAAMVARFDRLRDEIHPAMAAEMEAWDHGSVAEWEQQTEAARENIGSGLATTRQEWRDAGWFLGCDRLTTAMASQSSIYADDLAGFGPALARDGQTSNFTSTNRDVEAWLDLDLGAVQPIDSITVWNRANCCPERLSDFHVFVSDDVFVSTSIVGIQAQSGVLDLPFVGQAGPSETFAVGRTGRYVRVQLAGANYLSVGEVEIFGDPAAVSNTPDAVVLNEWNAVDSAKVPSGGDSYFGSVAGNGGDWFELVIVEDRYDLRGHRLQMSDTESGDGVRQITDTFVVTDDPRLADLRAGTIVTIAESVADDFSFDSDGGDWTINLQANSADDGAMLTPGSQSNFDANSSDWQLRILDRAGQVVADWAGEGIGNVLGVGASEVGELKADPATNLDRASYGDSDSSTFGAANRFAGRYQNFRPLRGLAPITAADVQLLLDALVGRPVELDPNSSDLDSNGAITLIDALLAAQALPTDD